MDASTAPSVSLANACARARKYSPFLSGALRRHPDLEDALLGQPIENALERVAVLADVPLRQRLRKLRDRTALVLGIADLGGALDLEGITGRLSLLADHALDEAIAASIVTVPEARSGGFTAIALGKHGSRELNYSSDIDPMLLYDPAVLPRHARDEPAQAAVRVARGVLDLLQTRDGDGYVFRVDLRLRPSPEVTPIALPVDAAISHYESSALAWERAAFVRARAAAGDVALGQRFLDSIRPFVWRRSVDFGAVAELRAISRRIRDHNASGQTLGPGYDLKRGRGGIREIEFFVQIHQLIHGGRDLTLRVGNTLEAIAALSSRGVIDEAIATSLADAYRLLRTIEHRLQMVDDLQTHSLPRDPAALDNVARLHGLENGTALIDLLKPHVDAVGTLYDALDDEERPATLPVDTLLAPFTDAGRRVAEWRSGRLRAVRSAAAREAFERVLPALLAAFAEAPDPDAALAAFDTMLGGLPSAINLFRLVEAQPGLLRSLVTVLAHAPALAEALGRRPALLDRLIDASAFDAVGDVESLAAEMSCYGEIEAKLDHVRLLVGEHRFALGVQIVEGAGDPIDVSAGYARVAEAAITTIASSVTAEFEASHGRVPHSDLVILALGRLGGGALTHASDLDLIYLYTGDHASESDGAKPLGASLYYNRLGQRLSAGLSAPTSVGALYQVDTRLRPSGNQGPLVVPVAAFERYQREDAWTWEHMALTRARIVHGPVEPIASIIGSVLRKKRDARSLAGDIVNMRGEMARHKPPMGPLDVKLGEGGLVDLEFSAHFHQLSSGAGLEPDLTRALRELGQAGLVRAQLGEAYTFLTRLIVTLRLVSPSLAEPPEASRSIVARACGAEDWDDLIARLAVARQEVSDAWRAVLARTED